MKKNKPENSERSYQSERNTKLHPNTATSFDSPLTPRPSVKLRDTHVLSPRSRQSDVPRAGTTWTTNYRVKKLRDFNTFGNLLKSRVRRRNKGWRRGGTVERVPETITYIKMSLFSSMLLTFKISLLSWKKKGVQFKNFSVDKRGRLGVSVPRDKSLRIRKVTLQN